jgi:tetratricopeptide (TPR) repeat protein
MNCWNSQSCFPRLLFSSLLFSLLVVVMALSVRGPINAAPPAQEFLEALRERGYYDTALDFLDQMRTSPLAPAAMKSSIEYERGRTLVMAAGVERDLARREQMLNQAQRSLDQFLSASPHHRLAHSTRNYLGNLLMVRGNMKVEEAERRGNTNLLSEAREVYDEAHKVFTNTRDELRARLQEINSKAYDPQTQREEIEIREQIRSDFLQSQLLGAMVLEARADTVEKDSDEYRELLEQAESEYRGIEEKYRQWMAGLYAKLYRGRCLQNLGKYPEALGLYRELLEEPEDSEAFRGLKQLALKQALEVWLESSAEGYAEAVDRGSQWLAKLRPADARQPEPLAIQFLLARANLKFSEQLRASNPRDRLASERLRAARQLAREVAKYPGEHQEAARKILADMQGGASEAEEQRPTPKSFNEARTAGRDAMDAMQNSNFLIDSLPARIESENDQEAKQELEQRLAQATENVQLHLDEAVDFFRLALQLVDSEVPVEDVNLVRLYLAHMLFLRGDYFDSGVLSEFVARRFPADNASREAGKIALAAYAQLYSQGEEGARDFETDRLKGVSEYIIDQWPDQAVAVDAWNAIIPFVIRDGEFDRVVAGLERIPESSPQRGDLELKVGRALWSAYRQGMSDLRREEREVGATSSDTSERRAELETWKNQAQQVLANGWNRVRAKDAGINESLAMGVLYLAQVYIDSQQADEAISLLEDEKYGPLALVGGGHSAAKGAGYAEETYRTALRAYLGNLQGSGAEESLAKAKGIMADLKSSVSPDAAGQQRLVAVYMGLARDMKGQMDLASDEERRVLSQGFSLFLSELSQEASDFQVLNWIAETFYNMADSLAGSESTRIPANAAEFYRKALESYKKILEKQSQNPEFLPNPQLGLALQIRTAGVHRRLGEFREAMEIFKAILTEKNQMLNVQVEAAKTFQVGASAPGFHNLYEKAIMGEYRDTRSTPPANIVWGWGKIARLTSGREEFREIFFEARYNLALCRFEFAKREQDAATKRRWLDLARQDVLFTYRLYPDLGGTSWKPRFDQLTKQIQQARGDRPVGLAEFATDQQAQR